MNIDLVLLLLLLLLKKNTIDSCFWSVCSKNE